MKQIIKSDCEKKLI